MTHECETLKLLDFAPRCLVAENGWLCCGSENGDFVAVRLDDPDGTNPNGPLNLDPEARLPLGFDSTREEIFMTLMNSRRTTKSLVAKSMKLATDRVNCITLWFPNALAAAAKEAYDEPLAILANNDCSVILVSLNDFDSTESSESLDPMDKISYPDFVNRAILSPDGSIMVAILDDPYLYVHVRVDKSTEPMSKAGRTPQYEWEQRQRLMLKSQRKDDKTDSRGSFAACFSNSGSLLAIGTQHGSISIFDVNLLLDPLADPLITTFNSSRPESGPGAIRDMSFCPGPFDILAWTEDRGHIGIADVRTNFVVRQIVDINDDKEMDRVNIFDRNTIDPRLLDGQSSRRETSHNATRQTGVASSRRDAEGGETSNQPLTPSETMVLEAIQGDRRRRDRVTQRGDQDSQPPSLPWAYLSSRRPGGSETDAARARQRSTSVSRGINDLSYREVRERTQERMQERIRAARASPRDGLDRPSQAIINRLGEAMRRDGETGARGDSSYQAVIDFIQQSRDRPSEHDEALSPIVNEVSQFVNRWEESAIRNTLAADHGVFEVPPSPDNTAGLAWSDDGRTL